MIKIEQELNKLKSYEYFKIAVKYDSTHKVFETDIKQLNLKFIEFRSIYKEPDYTLSNYNFTLTLEYEDGGTIEVNPDIYLIDDITKLNVIKNMDFFYCSYYVFSSKELAKQVNVVCPNLYVVNTHHHNGFSL